jgi:hypothetical protein
MILEAENGSFSDIVASILNLDPGILSCVLVSHPQGSVLARAAKSEFQQNSESLQKSTDGMAGHWAILAFNAMKRLDVARSKVKYLIVGREDHKTLILPANFSGTDFMLILAIGPRNESTEIYEKIISYFTAHS